MVAFRISEVRVEKNVLNICKFKLILISASCFESIPIQNRPKCSAECKGSVSCGRTELKLEVNRVKLFHFLTIQCSFHGFICRFNFYTAIHGWLVDETHAHLRRDGSHWFEMKRLIALLEEVRKQNRLEDFLSHWMRWSALSASCSDFLMCCKLLFLFWSCIQHRAKWKVSSIVIIVTNLSR